MTLIADTARVVGNVTLGKNVAVLYGAVIRGDFAPVKIGDNSNVQDNAVVHVEPGGPCVIGKYVTVAHGAIVHSSNVGDRVVIGMNATVLHGCDVGSDVIIAAGAVVTPGTKVPRGTLWAGVPARKLRNLTEDDKKSIMHYANEYTELIKNERKAKR